jgi:hypothetical protein
MKNVYPTRLFCLTFLIFGLSAICFGQKDLLKRTTYKTDKVEFGAGGTLSIIGAPNGSIDVEGWNKSEIGISAEIVVQAENETDLALLASVVGFMTDTGYAHTQIISVGPNDKKYLKTVAKKFPKHLLSLPYRIDFKIMVPAFCDLEIDGGNGDITLSKVEGTMRIKALETNAKLDLVGGTMVANFGKGNVDVTIPKSSWRGRNIDIQLAFGTMNVNLPKNLNAELDAQVLRTGSIENELKDLKKRARAEFTDKMISAKSGGGGANLSFTVGDGTLKLKESETPL